MLARTFEIVYYLTDVGTSPFIDWLESLKDRSAVARIIQRLDRVRLGNFGVFRSLHDGVFELKLDIGPGYRIYYALAGETIVLLLVGGDKSTQKKDIALAKEYWRDYQQR